MLTQQVPLAPRVVGGLPALSTSQGPGESDDARLVAAARRGDHAAYGALVRKYQDRLCSLLLHVCGSVPDAQDAAQEAFLRAYTKLDTYNGASAFHTWLFRIAMNVMISQHRRKQTRARFDQAQSLPTDILRGKSESPDESLLRQERAAQVQAALAKLSDEHRSILVLREVEGCDYDEIAGALAIPVGTVRSRLHRARLALREKLAPLASN